jgi:uncharacterized protein (TIGR02391 family)
MSPAQMQSAITHIRSRLGELEALDVNSIESRGDPKVLALESAIQATLGHVFGRGSEDYSRLRQSATLDTTNYQRLSLGRAASGISPDAAFRIPVSHTREGVEKGRRRALALLNQEVQLLEEQLTELGPAERAIRAYSDLDLHAEIARAASKLFQDGHYASAIEDAVKALNALVRLRSGVELDGANLMQKVFSPKNPILRFNDLADDNDRDEQRGFMMMFEGAVAGLRNPRAHKLIKDDPERALEFIAFVSLLAKLLDGATKAS